MDKKSLTNLRLQAAIALFDMIDKAIKSGNPIHTVDISFTATSAVNAAEETGKLRVTSYRAELLEMEDGTWSVESGEESDEIG